MAVRLVRAGRRGQKQEFALDNGLAVAGWYNVLDLPQCIVQNVNHR